MVNPDGRPLKYTPEELQKVIYSYFGLTPIEEWTVTGLALLVGCKQTWCEYGNRKDYKDMVTEARLKVENAYELSLRKNGRTGDIFALKNFGWQDKSEVENTHAVVSMPHVKIGGEELIFQVGDDDVQIEDQDADTKI